jgi:DNA repair exonuclease SbcCD ATPase subunit
MIQAEYITGDLPKEVDTSHYDQEFNSLKDEIRQMNNRESNVSNNTFDTLNNIIRERDITISNLYKDLNNIHVDYNKQMQDKNNEINEVKAQLAAKTLEFDRYKEQKEFEDRMKAEHQQNLAKIERELNGKITALNDDLDAANQDDLLDKASELAKNPIVEKKGASSRNPNALALH